MLHQKSSSSSAWVIGLALFSMFFGSGNLIFPMAVGQVAQEHYIAGSLGFLLTAVLLPFAGVVTMVLFKGDYTKVFACMGTKLGLIITFLLLTFWIPLGSGPRCITLAYAAIKNHIGTVPLWTFSGVYTVIVFALTFRENKIIGILGKVLTPVLLLSLACIVVKGVFASPGLDDIELTAGQVFVTGVTEGYYTQDLIASFFFSSSIIMILSHSPGHGPRKGYLALAMRSCLIGIVILAVVYLGLLYLGAAYSELLVNVSKDELLPTLALAILGPHFGLVSVLAVAMACMTTSVALALVFSNFIHTVLLHGRISHEAALAITVGSTFLMSMLGFEGISSILGPVMQIFYPGIIALIFVNMVKLYRRRRRRDQLNKANHEHEASASSAS